MIKSVDKAILISKGVEGRVTDLLDSLAQEGEKRKTVLPPKEEIENKLVEGGVAAAKKVLNHLKKDKEDLEKRVEGILQGLCEKFQLVSREDIEVIERMASKAREQVDMLKRRVEELEKKGA
ncbi:MAG: accessory factor UbiK family protein [Thermodesulfobacteriota bacterium]